MHTGLKSMFTRNQSKTLELVTAGELAMAEVRWWGSVRRQCEGKRSHPEECICSALRVIFYFPQAHSENVCNIVRNAILFVNQYGNWNM